MQQKNAKIENIMKNIYRIAYPYINNSILPVTLSVRKVKGKEVL